MDVVMMHRMVPPAATGLRFVNQRLRVMFNDGHDVVWTGLPHKQNVVTSVAGVALVYNGKIVVSFNSPRRVPAIQQDAGFMRAAPGYTLQRVLLYWGLARTFVLQSTLAMREDAERAQKIRHVLTCSDPDWRDVRDGRWQLPDLK
jgi:hypothetical protein